MLDMKVQRGIKGPIIQDYDLVVEKELYPTSMQNEIK